MEIEGEWFEIHPDVWAVFESWYGDKAYRHAGMVEAIATTAIRTAVDVVS
jgi:hypothetical protein